MDDCVWQLSHSLQTLIITRSDLHIDLALSDMKELRILICDRTVNSISIPQSLRCLHDISSFLVYWNPLRQSFPKIPKRNELAFLNWSGIKSTYGFWKRFERLTKLETLKLEFNEDKEILHIFCGRRKCVANFDKLDILRDVSLSYFNGKTISGFSSKHCNLRYLNLYRCDSLQCCPSVGDLFALEELSFNSCPKLEELPNLLNLARLQSVYIRYCGFKDVSCFGNLISLRSLSIILCCSLETLPDLHKLTRLENLEVRQCPNIVGWTGLSISKSSDTLWVNQPTTDIGMALQTLTFIHVGCGELPDLSLFPELKRLNIRNCWRLERLISTMPMTAMERFGIYECPKLQEVPDLRQCRLLTYGEIWNCGKISSMRLRS
jgi:Leucine-rich repeat (LRR) protein